MRPHRRPPTRLPCPWDSPGKNTGVGCHFLLQCMKVKSQSEVARSCPTLSDPVGSPPGFSVPGILQAGALERGAPAFSEGSREMSVTTAVRCPLTQSEHHHQVPRVGAGCPLTQSEHRHQVPRVGAALAVSITSAMGCPLTQSEHRHQVPRVGAALAVSITTAMGCPLTQSEHHHQVPRVGAGVAVQQRRASYTVAGT